MGLRICALPEQAAFLRCIFLSALVFCDPGRIYWISRSWPYQGSAGLNVSFIMNSPCKGHFVAVTETQLKQAYKKGAIDSVTEGSRP